MATSRLMNCVHGIRSGLTHYTTAHGIVVLSQREPGLSRFWAVVGNPSVTGLGKVCPSSARIFGLAEEPQTSKSETLHQQRHRLCYRGDVLEVGSWKIKSWQCSVANSSTSFQDRFSYLWDWQHVRLLPSVGAAEYGFLSG